MKKKEDWKENKNMNRKRKKNTSLFFLDKHQKTIG